jgi:hypothetical protein
MGNLDKNKIKRALWPGFLLFLLVNALAIQAQTYTVYPLRDSGGNTLNCGIGDDYDLLVDGSGNVHILWSESGYFYYGRVVYNAASGQFRISGKEYTNVNMYVDGMLNWFTQPRAAVRRDGQTFHFVWGDALKHAWRNSQGVWSKETVRTISGVQKCRAPSVVVGDDETVHVLYGYYDGSNGYDPTHLIYQRKPSGGSWSGYLEIDSAGYWAGAEWRNPVMALDAQGGIHASWSNQIYWMTPEGGAARYRYAPAGSSLESSPTVIIPRAPGVLMSGVGNIFVDSSGKVHRTICSSDSSIDYSSKPSGSSGSWAATTRPSIGLLQTPEDSWASLTTDNCGRVLVAFADGSTPEAYPNVYLSVLDQGVWSKTTVSTSAGLGFFRQPALAAGGGTLFLLWRENSGLLYLATTADNCSPLKVTSPNGGESWQAGTTKEITWTGAPEVANVKIDMSFDGGTVWSTIIASTPNDGSYLWSIGTTPSLNCVMRVGDVLGTTSDRSDGMFVLTSPPSLTDNYFIMPAKWTDTGFGDDGWYTGDFNGDGRDDLLRYDEGGGTTNQVLLSTGVAFAAAANWLTAYHGDDGWHVGDYNGDGRSDILRYVSGLSGAQVFLSDGTKFVNAGSWTGKGKGDDGWYVGDFNGDGRDDLLRYLAAGTVSDVLLSDGTKFNYYAGWSTAWNGNDGWYVGDFNGDGRSDLMRYNPGVSGGEVYLSDGTKFNYSGSWTGAGNGDNGWYLGKFSGTARTDIMRYVLLLSGADVFLNTGTKFTYDGSWTPAGRGDNDWHVGDYNGDGRSDLMRSIVGVTGADVLVSARLSGGSSASATEPAAGDVLWQNDVPERKELSAEDQAFVDAIKNRLQNGEEITVNRAQQEYERLTGKRRTRAGMRKLLKGWVWQRDSGMKPGAQEER